MVRFKRKIIVLLVFAAVCFLFSNSLAAGQAQRISGNIVDVVKSKIYPGTLVIKNDKIEDIIKENKKYDTFIIPGLVDAHVHTESSLLVPTEFARLAVVHGTVATVSDHHYTITTDDKTIFRAKTATRNNNT